MIGKYLTIAKNGLWTSNTTLVQMLGLCPTLAVLLFSRTLAAAHHCHRQYA